jgi:AcrR family transcriptional regulator
MFKTSLATAKSEETRRLILETALKSFRERGLEGSTMREIAKEAGVAMGAAYYYFPTKEAIVLAYYQSVQDEHDRRLAEFDGISLNLRERLGIVFHSKIDIILGDRKLLGGLFRYTGIPEHPLSFLGPETSHLRKQSMAVFSRALEKGNLPADLAQLLTLALWSLHMGSMLYFLYDDSKEQQCTRRLIDHALDLTVHLVGLARFPLLKPVRSRVLSLLSEAELLPETSL